MDMMKHIRECADRVLDEVARGQRINILSIAGHLGERNLIVYQAVGWLAREGKIAFQREGNQVYLAVSGKET